MHTVTNHSGLDKQHVICDPKCMGHSANEHKLLCSSSVQLRHNKDRKKKDRGKKASLGSDQRHCPAGKSCESAPVLKASWGHEIDD